MRFRNPLRRVVGVRKKGVQGEKNLRGRGIAD
jgi:hypothetical protein